MIKEGVWLHDGMKNNGCFTKITKKLKINEYNPYILI